MITMFNFRGLKGALNRGVNVRSARGVPVLPAEARIRPHKTPEYVGFNDPSIVEST